ncbi:MAG: type IV pilus assembly protein PilM [Gemmataceae bacterium]|nr:type IV pilus assembly protein PilM [Gemmataceae bacterium]
MATPQPGVWGIDLGQCALKALRLEMIDGAVTATAFDYIEHPKILSQPDADPDLLIREALMQFLSRNKLKGDLVVIGVPGQSGLARFVKLPPVEEKKIVDIVRFEAKQQIPFPLEEVVWDFQKINEGTVTDGFALETEIGLFAMKRDMINRALQHFKDVNVEVHIIQMAPLALVNYVAYDLLSQERQGEEGKRDCVVALDIGTDNSNLVITDGDKIIWQRPIPLGGNHFTRALTKDMKLTFAKAEHLKRNAVKSPELKKILAALKPVLNDFVGEVQRSLGYFTNTHRDANIQYMIGLGNAFRLPGMQKYLQEKLGLEVRKLATFERVQGDAVLSAPQFSENIMSFGVPYGLALQGLKQTKLQTNLLPYEVRVERIVRGKKPWAVAAAAALLLMVFGMTLGQSMARSNYTKPEVKAAIEEAKKALKLRSDFENDVNNIKKEIEASEKALDKIGAGVKERMQWPLLIQYINMALPQPYGAKLTTEARSYNKLNVLQTYKTKEAESALFAYDRRRFPKGNIAVNAQKLAEEDEFIKKHLIQISIEGINALYSDDLAPFFKKLKKDAPTLPGMKSEEQQAIESEKDLPSKGWVVEIRGYTYHDKGQKFIEHTLLENLKYPEQPNVNDRVNDYVPPRPNEKLPLSKEWDPQKKAVVDSAMKKHVLDHVGFFVLYKVEKVKDPEPGIFVHIKTSALKSLIRGEDASSSGGAAAAAFGAIGKPGSTPPGGVGVQPGQSSSGESSQSDTKTVSRDGWHPLGEVASAVLAEGGGGGLGTGLGAVGSATGKPGAGSLGPGPMGTSSSAPQGNAATGTTSASKSAVPLQPRTEFILLFVWKDATPAAEEKK